MPPFRIHARILCAALTLALFVPITAHAQQQPAAPTQPDEVFDDWAKVCGDNPETNQKECFIFQNVTTQEGQRILHLTVLKFPGAPGPIMVVTVPLGVYLPPGLNMTIDGGNARPIEVQICTGNGCQAQVEMNDAVMQSFRAGIQGSMKMFDPEGREVNVPFSLKGFTAAYNSLP